MGFFESITIQQIADISFGIIVAGICFKTLFGDKYILNKQKKVWKDEFSNLEGSLRQLIDEATVASEVYDRQIQKRKNELESLLKRAEKSIIKTSQASNSATTQNLNQKVEVSKNNGADKIDPPWALEKTEEHDLPSNMERSLKKARKGAELRYQALTSMDKVSTESKSNTLKEQIEIEEEESLSDKHIFEQTSILDEVAFKIAKRLLLEGKELHIVARKLELPVSEIRHLDSLLRREAQKENQPLPKALAEKEIKEVKSIVREQKKNNASKSKNLQSEYYYENKESEKKEEEDSNKPLF